MPHPMPASQSWAPQAGKGGGGGGGGMRGERVSEGGHVSHETGQLERPWGKSQQLEQIDIEEHGMEPPPLDQNKPLFDWSTQPGAFGGDGGDRGGLGGGGGREGGSGGLGGDQGGRGGRGGREGGSGVVGGRGDDGGRLGGERKEQVTPSTRWYQSSSHAYWPCWHVLWSLAVPHSPLPSQ